ncbi:MAG: oligosaccharide flippase family protein [Bacteroidota bacterium]
MQSGEPVGDRGAQARGGPTSTPSLRKNAWWVALGQVVVKPLWFMFITAACMRYLGPASYGIFSATLALATLAATVSDLGTTNFTTRALARDQSQRSALLTNTLVARVGLALLAGIGVVIAAWVLGYSRSFWFSLGAACLYGLAFQLTEYCRAFYRAAEVLRDEALLSIAEKLIVITGGLALLLTTRQPGPTLLGMALGMCLVFALNLGWVHVRYARIAPSTLDVRFLVHTLRAAWPIGLVLVFSAVPLSAGPVLTEALLGEEAAGLYGSAQRILEALQSLSFVFVVTTFARLSGLFHAGRVEEYRYLVRRSLLLLMVLSVTIAALLSVSAPWLIGLIDQGRFEETGDLLRSMSWLFPLMASTYVLMFALMSADDHNVAAWLTGAAAVASVLLMAELLPRLGLIGPAVSLFIVYGLVTAVALWHVERRVREKQAPEAFPTQA